MNLKLKIRKRSQPEWLVWLLAFIPFTFGIFFDLLPLPSAIKYAADAAWVLLIVLVAANLTKQNVDISKELKIASLWILVFLVFTFVVYIFNFQSPFYYLMGVRNNFRFYFAFIAFAVFLTEDDIASYLKIFDVLFWVNAAAMLFQYFALGYKQDFLGGIFGTQAGCNGFVNIFFIIICAKSITAFLEKSEKTYVMLGKCSTALLLSAFAEIKFFYVEFVAIIIIAVLISGNSWRKILVVISGLVAVIVFVNLLIHLFPYFSELKTLEMVFESQSRYSGVETVGRLNAMSQVSDRFLETTIQKLTGLGLGNCETSTVALFNTPFYEKYGYIRYFWFSTAHITLETGFIGFSLFAGFFVLVFIISILFIVRNAKNNFLAKYAAVVALCSILVVVYNSSLRTEAAYMIYFVLSLPFAAIKNSSEVVTGE